MSSMDKSAFFLPDYNMVISSNAESKTLTNHKTVGEIFSETTKKKITESKRMKPLESMQVVEVMRVNDCSPPKRAIMAPFFKCLSTETSLCSTPVNITVNCFVYKQAGLPG